MPKHATERVRIVRYRDGDPQQDRDVVAVEEPLEIRVAAGAGSGQAVPEAFAVTMRTPGDDFPLVAGFLCSEGVIAGRADLLGLTYCRGGAQQEYNVVEARLAPGVPFDLARQRRNVYTTSSCGVCGVASIEAIEARACPTLSSGSELDRRLVVELPGRLRAEQGLFARTGGLHAAGLFGLDGEERVVMEDVGRHNAVDKVVGRVLLDGGLPASDTVLVVSGRASFELVQKSLVAGVPMLVAVGAPSSLAVQLATRAGQTLVGFTRDGGFNVYAGAERVR